LTSKFGHSKTKQKDASLGANTSGSTSSEYLFGDKINAVFMLPLYCVSRADDVDG
jgi:hypothetical protein